MRNFPLPLPELQPGCLMSFHNSDKGYKTNHAMQLGNTSRLILCNHRRLSTKSIYGIGISPLPAPLQLIICTVHEGDTSKPGSEAAQKVRPRTRRLLIVDPAWRSRGESDRHFSDRLAGAFYGAGFEVSGSLTRTIPEPTAHMAASIEYCHPRRLAPQPRRQSPGLDTVGSSSSMVGHAPPGRACVRVSLRKRPPLSSGPRSACFIAWNGSWRSLHGGVCASLASWLGNAGVGPASEHGQPVGVIGASPFPFCSCWAPSLISIF